MGYDKTRFRMEQAVRLELANLGLTDAEIAEHIGLTPNGYAQMKMRPEFKKIRTSMVTGALSDLDMELAENKTQLSERLRDSVPIALETLIFHALNRVGNPEVSRKAANDILDREGTFIKASRFAGVEDQARANKMEPITGTSVSKEDKVADELSAALNAARVIHKEQLDKDLEDMRPASEHKQ